MWKYENVEMPLPGAHLKFSDSCIFTFPHFQIFKFHMNVLLIEDEQATVKKVREILNRIDNTIRIIGTADTIDSSLQWLDDNPAPDLILVNKDLLTERTRENKAGKWIKAEVTFVSPSFEYSFDALRINQLKSLTQQVQQTAASQKKLPVTRSIQRDKPGTVIDTAEIYKTRFLVRQGARLVAIDVKDIAYFFSEGRFNFFRTFSDQKFMVDYTIETLAGSINPAHFFRISRSFLISFNAVQQIHPYFGHRLKLYLRPATDKEVLVSRSRIIAFKNWLGE
jgi:two-component system, LytTR family, response regulator LytT